MLDRLLSFIAVGTHAILCVAVASADVRLPAVFSEHMVLQQQQKIRIWGSATENELVTVALEGNNATTRASATGHWEVELAPMLASKTPMAIKVTGNNTIQINDVLIGEVWLCSGQSNMEWPVAACLDAKEEIASAEYPMIRHIKIPLVLSTVPLNDFQASWQVCSPVTVGSFTACGYFMARQLHKELDIPIGLVNASWGGTRIEPWTPACGFQRVEKLQDIFQSVIGRTPGTVAYRDRLTTYIQAVEDWTVMAKLAVNSTTNLVPIPSYPPELTPFGSNQDPTMLYNGMIHALAGFPIRGVIWYQGESNHSEGMLYLEKMKALISGWREVWGQGEFPFYFVQIAPFQYGNEDPTILPKFWEAQTAAQAIPHTGMVVINDIATLDDIHPPNKQDVGFRLALLALQNDYGNESLVANSPEFDSLEVLGDRLQIHFGNTGGGLSTRDGKAPSHFEVTGVGTNGFQVANAEIDGDTVVLTSENVASPVAFRFAWHMLAEPNLTGGTGMPVGAFRGGVVPDFMSTLPIANEYSLVYDLDLSKLSHQPVYDVDNSDSIKAFDRVGYLVELTMADGEDKKVFVSMNAFTDDLKKIGIPTLASEARFQCAVNAMDVYSNMPDMATGINLKTGNIEFWPDNYGMRNSENIVGASSSIYDFGDEIAPPADGYGSMQIHNYGAGQTLIAINHWVDGRKADIGLGNGPISNTDWTFTSNAESYTSKRLRVYVRQNSQ